MDATAVRFLLVQLASGRDAGANLAAIRAQVVAGAAAGARVIVLPEYAAAFDPRGVGTDLAEDRDGEFVRELTTLRAEHDVVIVAGVTFRSPDPDRATNTVVVVSGGALRGTYTKVHLYDAFGQRESERLAPGDPACEPLVIDVDGLRIGVQTCYDLRFPEVSRRLVDAGATVLVVPAAWAAGPSKLAHWRILAQARAIENTSAVLAVGQSGPGVVGHTLAVGADGTVLGELGAETGTLVVDLDPEAIAAVRHRNPSLAHRRYAVHPLPPRG